MQAHGGSSVEVVLTTVKAGLAVERRKIKGNKGGRSSPSSASEQSAIGSRPDQSRSVKRESERLYEEVKYDGRLKYEFLKPNNGFSFTGRTESSSDCDNSDDIRSRENHTSENGPAPAILVTSATK